MERKLLWQPVSQTTHVDVFRFKFPSRPINGSWKKWHTSMCCSYRSQHDK